MLDKRGRDQFVIRYRDQTEIYWNDAARSQVPHQGLGNGLLNESQTFTLVRQTLQADRSSH